MFTKSIISFLAVFLSLSARADYLSWRNPRGYVVVCQGSSGQTVEPLEFYENQVTTFAVDPSLSFDRIAQMVLERLKNRAENLADAISPLLASSLEHAEFFENIDLVAEPGETIPSVSNTNCQVKKLYRHLTRDMRLPYAYAFDVVLWKALTESQKAAVIVSLAIERTRYSEFPYEKLDLPYEGIRKITAMAFSSRLDQMSDQEWFSNLEQAGVKDVTFQGIRLKVDGAEFYEKTGVLRSAIPAPGYWDKFPGVQISLRLKNLLTFYPNGSVNRFTVADGESAIASAPFQDARENYPMSIGLITGACETALYENHSVREACFSGAKLYSARYSLNLSGYSTFYSNGNPRVSRGFGVVRLSGRLIEVNSNEVEMQFDEDGYIQSGTVSRPTRIFTSNATFELAPRKFIADPNGNFRSAYLYADVDAKDCHGVMRHYSAGSQILFNPKEEPCEN